MNDMQDLLNVIKKASMDAVEASKPSDFCYGTVTSISPLKISIDQKMSLGSAQLVLTRNVTDYKVKVTVAWETETTDLHSHTVDGEKELTIHNALAVGEKVILIRQKGGQKYLVLDRVVNVL